MARNIRRPRPLRSIAAGDARRFLRKNPDPVARAEADRRWLEAADARVAANLAVLGEISGLLAEITAAEAELAPLAARFGPPPAAPDRGPPVPPPPKTRKPRRPSAGSPFLLVEVRLPAARTPARVHPPRTPGAPWIVAFAHGHSAYPEAPAAIAAARYQHAGTRARLEAARAVVLEATDRMVAARRRVLARLVWLSE